MARRSGIEWTQTTWNPVTGCSKTSPGCLHCYAERMARRLQAMGQPNYAQGFQPTLHPHMLDLPLRWKTPSVIFVNSMSDLFHEQIPSGFIQDVFDRMNRSPQHTFQVLTKRSRRLRGLSPDLPWTPNIWMGVSVESQEWVFRADDLRGSGAAVKFISFEPLLGPIDNISLQGIDWVIVGGESGPRARSMRRCKCPLLLQAMGRLEQKENRPAAQGQDVGRHAADPTNCGSEVMRKQAGKKTVDVEALKHKDKRTNIPTEELRNFVPEKQKQPQTLLYPRDPSLDPQLVWKGKDE